jgi:nickel/cobalt transporter (NiCoT) family protein
VVFGGLSVLLYKPWRRRIDRKRLGNAHFEPLPQSPDTAVRNDEEQSIDVADRDEATKNVDVVVQSVEATDLAGPAHR